MRHNDGGHDDGDADREIRSETLCVKVTPRERRAVLLVVEVERPDGGISGLLRTQSFADVVERGRRYIDRLATLGPEGKGGAK